MIWSRIRGLNLEYFLSYKNVAGTENPETYYISLP